jgi:predicted dehydrogenase
MMTALNWGLIGAGDIARKRVAPALRDAANCRLVAVSRSRAELAKEFALEFGARRWFARLEDLLADAEIEAVYLATPVYLHAAQAIAAAEAGKHVLCEKPMALTTADCDRMIAAARANNVRLGVAYYRHFYPLVARVKEIIDSGELGKISLAQINAFEFFNPPEDHPRYWFLERAKSGGGPMMDFGCHRLEVLTNLFGTVKQLKSLISNEVFGREVEDTACALLQFENGACANLSVTHAAAEAQDALDIFGTNGSIHVPVLNGSEMLIKTETGERTERHAPAENIHQPLIEDFADAVLNGKKPAVTGETGREIARLEEEIYAD